jgi:hypothetical protein
MIGRLIPRSVERTQKQGSIDMGPIGLFALFGLILLVTALGGSKLAQRAVLMIVGLMGAVFIAIAILYWVRSA